MTDNEKFHEAIKTASLRNGAGLHGSVGTQNERLVHASLKNYYAPCSDEQEIRIGSFFADAVCEDGIFEIQTRGLHRLNEKLAVFLEYSRVTVVHPVIRRYRWVYINSESGEVTKETPFRSIRSDLGVFEELYSIRNFLDHENLRVILAMLSLEKRVYHVGSEPPDLSNKSRRRKCVIEKAPLELLGETILEIPRDYAVFLPEDLPERFTKKQLCEAAGESRSSLRAEILRTMGIIRRISKIKNEFVYTVDEAYKK